MRSAAFIEPAGNLNKPKGKYSPHCACKVPFLSCSYAKKCGKGASEEQFESGEKKKKKARLELDKNSSFLFDAFIVFIYL